MVRKRDDQAFCILPSKDLQADIDFYTRQLALHLHTVYPTSEPQCAELTGFGLSLLLDVNHRGDPGALVFKTEEGSRAPLRSPTGTEIRWEASRLMPTQTFDNHRIEICTLRNSPWAPGRAGTHTRELIPSRLGGGIVASHIRIPNGGPVADRVHYHTTGFQLVFCVQGWIKLIYEDQGQPVVLMPGDCVNQPPHIRHCVLDTSNGLEVIELSTPAEHVTAIDNEMVLPNDRVDSHRLYHGQRFCHYQHAKARWQAHRLPGFAASDAGVSVASGNTAGVNLLRAAGTTGNYRASHTAQVLFSFVLTGSVRINKQLMVAGDAFTLPPHDDYAIGDISSDASLLEVSLPGVFDTAVT